MGNVAIVDTVYTSNSDYLCIIR